jgi:hypothetical protein
MAESGMRMRKDAGQIIDPVISETVMKSEGGTVTGSRRNDIPATQSLAHAHPIRRTVAASGPCHSIASLHGGIQIKGSRRHPLTPKS